MAAEVKFDQRKRGQRSRLGVPRSISRLQKWERERRLRIPRMAGLVTRTLARIRLMGQMAHDDLVWSLCDWILKPPDVFALASPAKGRDDGGKRQPFRG